MRTPQRTSVGFSFIGILNRDPQAELLRWYKVKAGKPNGDTVPAGRTRRKIFCNRSHTSPRPDRSKVKQEADAEKTTNRPREPVVSMKQLGCRSPGRRNAGNGATTWEFKQDERTGCPPQQPSPGGFPWLDGSHVHGCTGLGSGIPISSSSMLSYDGFVRGEGNLISAHRPERREPSFSESGLR